MGESSRTKGAAAEREVASILRAHGYPVVRTPNSGGLHIPGDIIGMPLIHMEVKRAEALRIPEWLRQTEADCPADWEPVLVFRQSREPWRVIEPLETWLGRL